MNKLSDLIDAALAVREDVRANGNTFHWACMFEAQVECEARLSRLDAALIALGTKPPEPRERRVRHPPAETGEVR